MDKKNKRVRHLSLLLFFLLGGVIVGETVSLTMVVTAFGPGVLGKLFFVNGLLLLLLPPLFFNRIDTINRGTFLTAQFGVTAVILCVCLLILGPLHTLFPSTMGINRIVVFIYPISYLSKTLLFLTFWTLANDLFGTEEAKKGFPIIAAWGFAGGLIGACIARILLARFDISVVIVLWIVAYGIGMFLTQKITKVYGRVFRKKEHVEKSGGQAAVFSGIEKVWQNKLIRGISAMYFFVFVAIFLQDYLFWKKSAVIFATSQSLASFQFSFYLFHSIATIAGLWYVMPPLIRARGFPRIFPALPIMLFSGSIILLVMNSISCTLPMQFAVFLGIQFGRQVVFENAFSPIYQMFFAAVPQHTRGRAKTFLEGVAKPLAILVAGILIMCLGQRHIGIELIIAVSSLILIIVSFNIRAAYQAALIQRVRPNETTDRILAQIGSHTDQKIVSLIREYAHAQSSDVRNLAVKLLGIDGSKQAYKILVDLYYDERNAVVKERVARSLGLFPLSLTQQFITKLLQESEARIRTNAIHSVNHLRSPRKGQYYPVIRPMLFENNPRVQIEAARYIWEVGSGEDRLQVNDLMMSLSSSSNQNRRSAGLLLVGLLKPDKWETVLMNNLTSSSFQVFSKCLEVLLSSASCNVKAEALCTVEGMSRRHSNAAGRILASVGPTAFNGACVYIARSSDRRMWIEVVHALRKIVVDSGTQDDALTIDNTTQSIIVSWVKNHLQGVYYDAVIWYAAFAKNNPTRRSCAVLLEDAVQSELLRSCEWALDVLVLLDSKRTMAAIRRDFNLMDHEQRIECAEILESGWEHVLTPLIVPILRSEALEDIAAIGRQRFGLSGNGHINGLLYFIESKNKWICFCALHCAYRYASQTMPADIGALLMKLKDDSNPYLAASANAMLNMQSGKSDGGIVEPFVLLERVMALKKTPLFSQISAEKLMALAEATQNASYARGDIVSKEGDVAEQLYIVRSGNFHIYKNVQGTEVTIGQVLAGEMYGEIGLFNQAPRYATAIAKSSCEVWIIQRAILKKYILDIPEIAYMVLVAFSEKLQRSSEELAQCACARHTTTIV